MLEWALKIKGHVVIQLVLLLAFSSVQAAEDLCRPEQEYLDNNVFSSISSISQQSLQSCFFDKQKLSPQTLSQFQLADIRSSKSKAEVLFPNAISISVQSLLALSHSNSRKFAVISDSLDAANLSQLCDSQAAKTGRIKVIPYGIRGAMTANQSLQYMKGYSGNINGLNHLLEYVLPADNLKLVLLTQKNKIETPEYLTLHTVNADKVQQVVDRYAETNNILVIFSRQEFPQLALDHQFKLMPALYAFDDSPKEAVQRVINNRKKRVHRPTISALHECG